LRKGDEIAAELPSGLTDRYCDAFHMAGVEGVGESGRPERVERPTLRTIDIVLLH
jgi:hypothetical protein